MRGRQYKPSILHIFSIFVSVSYVVLSAVCLSLMFGSDSMTGFLSEARQDSMRLLRDVENRASSADYLDGAPFYCGLRADNVSYDRAFGETEPDLGGFVDFLHFFLVGRGDGNMWGYEVSRHWLEKPYNRIEKRWAGNTSTLYGSTRVSAQNAVGYLYVWNAVGLLALPLLFIAVFALVRGCLPIVAFAMEVCVHRSLPESGLTALLPFGPDNSDHWTGGRLPAYGDPAGPGIVMVVVLAIDVVWYLMVASYATNKYPWNPDANAYYDRPSACSPGAFTHASTKNSDGISSAAGHCCLWTVFVLLLIGREPIIEAVASLMRTFTCKCFGTGAWARIDEILNGADERKKGDSARGTRMFLQLAASALCVVFVALLSADVNERMRYTRDAIAAGRMQSVDSDALEDAWDNTVRATVYAACANSLANLLTFFVVPNRAHWPSIEKVPWLCETGVGFVDALFRESAGLKNVTCLLYWACMLVSAGLLFGAVFAMDGVPSDASTYWKDTHPGLQWTAFALVCAFLVVWTLMTLAARYESRRTAADREPLVSAAKEADDPVASTVNLNRDMASLSRDAPGPSDGRPTSGMATTSL